MTPAVDPRRHAVEQFLYREARLLDEGRLEEWLELFSPDAVYWLPAGNGDIDPTQHVSIIYDTRREMNARVARLRSGYAHAQDPASRMYRLLSNVEVENGDDGTTLVAHCVMVLFALTHHGTEIHSARCQFALRPEGDSWKIAQKKVVLLRCDEALEAIPYLV
jgi:3-phenylpropionate/cinnamic acid dioxygenase small subunit